MGPIDVNQKIETHASHFVTSAIALRHGYSLLGCAERSSPEAVCGAPKARGLTAYAQPESQ
jgi:hypothetical protein